MIHSLKIFFTLIAINIKVTLTYRASLVISFFLSAVWVAAFVIFIEVIFSNVTSLGGMTKGETLLIMAFYYLFSNIQDIFYRDGFEDFPEKMRTGYVDAWLTKPGPTRMLTFMSSMRFDYLASIGITAALFAYAFREMGTSPNILRLAIGVGLSLLMHIIFFSLLSIVATVNFWLDKNDTLSQMSWQMSQVARYPREIYTSVARFTFSYILPLSIIANLPAQITLNIGSMGLLVTFIITACVIYTVSYLFWKKGLTRYSSAG